MVQMIELKVAELEGPALDWAVGIADGRELELPSAVSGRTGVVWCEPFEIRVQGEVIGHDKTRRYWKPSTDWSQGGPLIDKHDVELVCFGSQAEYDRDRTYNQKPVVAAYIIPQSRRASYSDFHIESGVCGPTRLIAAMRCIVTNKLGDVVSVPADLAQSKRGGGE